MTCRRIRDIYQKFVDAQSLGNQTQAQKIHFQMMDHEIWHALGASVDCRTDRERVYEKLYR